MSMLLAAGETNVYHTLRLTLRLVPLMGEGNNLLERKAGDIHNALISETGVFQVVISMGERKCPTSASM